MTFRKNSIMMIVVSLVAVTAFMFSGTSTVYADKDITVHDDGKYSYLSEILDLRDFKKSFSIHGTTYSQDFTTKDLGNDTYRVQNIISTDSSKGHKEIVLEYEVKKIHDGFEVNTPDQTNLTVKKEGSSLSDVGMEISQPIIQISYVKGMMPATIVTEDAITINNEFVSGSDFP